MGSGIGNLLKYFLVMDSRKGWFYVQRISMVIIVIFVMIFMQKVNSSAKGLLFIRLINMWSIILLTFVCISVMGASVSEDKEYEILPLLMMTGISNSSYILAKFCSKYSHILLLTLMPIPPSIFAVTLGGVSLSQITASYLYILLWCLFCSSFSLWLSVLFSSKKEVYIVATPAIILLMIFLSYLNLSPLSRIELIFSNSSISILDIKEILLVIPISIYFLYSSIKNLTYGVLFPITFLDEFVERRKNKFRKSMTEAALVFRSNRFTSSNFIEHKDKILNPVRPLFGEGLANAEQSTVILFIFSLPFLIGFYVGWAFFGGVPLTWLRIIEVFSQEKENQTWSSLNTLPFSSAELLKLKLDSATPYFAPALITLILGAPLLLAAISSANLHLILKVALIPSLYFSIIYMTILVVFKVNEMVKITSFILLILMIMIYLLPFTQLLFYPAHILLKKLCMREIENCGEITD